MKKIALYPGMKHVFDTTGYQQSDNKNHLESCYSHIPLETLYGYQCDTEADVWLYPIPLSFCIDKDSCSVTTDSHIQIPDEVMKLVNDNRCILLFDYSSEAIDPKAFSQDPVAVKILSEMNICDYTFLIIKNTIKKYNILRNQALFITGNIYYRDTDPDFRTCFMNLHENSAWIERLRPVAQSEKVKILHRQTRSKKLVCLTNRAKPSRMWTAYQVYKLGLLDDNNLTMGECLHGFNYSDEIIQDKEFLDSLPWKLPGEPEHNRVWKNMVSDHYIKAHTDAYVSYIHESFDDVPGPWSRMGSHFSVTEKSFAPMLMMKPFVIQGGETGTLGYLRSLGYETFNRWWDESYDHLSGMDKVHECFQIFTDLNRMSHTDLADMLYEMFPVLEHNFHQYDKNQIEGFHARRLKYMVTKLT